MHEALYHDISVATSKLITNTYSTSFSMATRLFDKPTRRAIYSIYGFVRIADEIVDTFHAYNKEMLLAKFEDDYHHAVLYGISTNPVLNAFQATVKKYQIDQQLVEAFIKSMKADLKKRCYHNTSELQEYVYGSADVVGLMCLKVFCNGNHQLYENLKLPAQKLGSAFQKVNFLRDLNEDFKQLGRVYFPELNDTQLTEPLKNRLIVDIEDEFNTAFQGIRRLPGRSKLAVLIAYYYYLGLLHKIRQTPSPYLMTSRIRISNPYKVILLLKAMIVYKLKLI